MTVSEQFYEAQIEVVLATSKCRREQGVKTWDLPLKESVGEV